MAAINGGLLLHYSLSYVERFLADDSAQKVLEKSYISDTLLRQFGWYLMGASAFCVLAILVGLLFEREDQVLVPAAAYPAEDPALYQEAVIRQRAARLPRAADQGKYEPSRSRYDPTTQRYAADAPRAQDTIQVPPVDTSTLTYGGGSTNRSARTTDFESDEWSNSIQTSGAPAESAGKPNGLQPGSIQPQTSESTWGNPPQSPERIRTDAGSATVQKVDLKCRLCGAELTLDDSFCPRCGASVTEQS
jgi:hypothetical protein